MENIVSPRKQIDTAQLSEREAFLAAVAPFQALPRAELETIAANLSSAVYEKGRRLFVQEKTRIPHILLVRSGRLERTIQSDDSPVLREVLEAGGIFGGISLLFNNGISTSTVYCIEAAGAYLLDRENFLRLCLKYPDFSRFFAQTLDLSREQSQDQNKNQSKARPAAETAGPAAEAGLGTTFLWETVADKVRTFPSCPAGTTIRQTAALLTASRRSAVLILDGNSQPIGLVTDADLRKKVIVDGLSPENPVELIMSSPLIRVDSEIPVFEAVLTMMRHRIKHLAVFQKSRIKGVITERDLLLARSHSPMFLIHEIQTANGVAELRAAYEKLPGVIRHLIAGGGRAPYLNAIITATTDAVLFRLMDITLEALGPPPVRFAFLLFGSEGRKEQTLKTDQDNAIVFEDAAGGQPAQVTGYFTELGSRVCDGLNEIGQKHCEFDIMAKNPAWCQPLSRWKAYYRRWLESDDPEAMLKAGIFFDFRLGYGSQRLVDELHAALFDKLADWPGMLRQMARNTLHYRPPLGLFGNFVLQDRKEGRKGLDIKSAMRLVVDFGRIYALQAGMVETNTVKRLQALHQQGRLDQSEFDDLMHAYEFLMHLRLKHQSTRMEEAGGEPDNLLQPERLTTIDQQTLKEAFKQIRIVHARLRMDFFLHTPA